MRRSALRRRYVRARGVGRIEGTGLLPYAVADGVLDEVENYTGDTIAFKHTLAEALGEKAETVYAHNPKFRRQVQGAAGRDHLWTFMRHWVASELRTMQPSTYRKLPDSFKVGRELHGRAR